MKDAAMRQKEDKKEMLVKNKKITTENSAVSGVIAAILMLGLLMTVLSIIQTVYVPQWTEENEFYHMDETLYQFSNLKFAIDIQLYHPDSSNIEVTTPIKLGCEKIPYLSASPSNGEIKITPDNLKITIHGDNDIKYSIGTIEYRSYNSYFVDQIYTYENGALILSQKQGDIMYSSPFLSVNNSENNVNLSLTLVNISDINNGEPSIYGHTTCLISTRYSGSQITSIKNISNITIETEHTNCWYNYLNETFSDENLDFDLNQGDNKVYIDCSSSKNVNATIRAAEITAEIRPGI